MAEPYRVLIAYDGSPTALDMLDGLAMAGLPDRGEALLLSVAERWLPPPSLYEVVESPIAIRGPAAARALAESAAALVRARLQNWKVLADAETGSPAKVIIERAREWDTQLIIAGSLGHNALERMLIGSVSHKIANEAHCSVRIARPTGNSKSPLLLIGYDGYRAAELAVKAVAARNWAKGSRARVVMAIGFGSPARDVGLSRSLDRARSRIACIADMLKSAGLDVSTGIYEGDPRKVLIEQATDWGASCIFAGDNDESALDRVVLGTVANALLARAPCSVEIVR